MGAVAELIEALIVGGMNPAIAAGMVARAGAEMSSVGPSKGAIRTARWRAKQASQSVTERHTVTLIETTDEASQSVTKRHKASHGDNALLLTSLDTQDKDKKVRGPKRARPSPLPDGWRVPERARPIALELGVNIEQTDDRFRDYLASSGKLYADYDAAFCNFVRNTPKFNGATQTPKSPTEKREPQPGFYASFSSDEMVAWANHERLIGKSYPRDKAGGWRFPTQWPPGLDPPRVENREGVSA